MLSFAKSDNFSDPLDALISFRFSTITLTTSAYNNIGVIGIVSEQLQGKLWAYIPDLGDRMECNRL